MIVGRFFVFLQKNIKMQYDWLLFDLDNTILNFTKAMDYAFEKTLVDYEIPQDEPLMPVYKVINKQCWKELEEGLITQDELRYLRFERFIKRINSDINSTDFANSYHANLSDKIFWLENAQELIRKWSKKYNLALVTNGFKEIQRARLVKMDMDDCFKHIVISDEIGSSKPHQAFFDYTFSKIGKVDKERVIIIGDNPGSDIQGGMDYGIHTCWINANDNPLPEGIKPNYTIKKLSDLDQILK